MPKPSNPQTDDKRPEAQQGEEHGKIKRPQQTDATMAGKDLPRGSEPETHARK
jgi:hypothetical protein